MAVSSGLARRRVLRLMACDDVLVPLLLMPASFVDFLCRDVAIRRLTPWDGDLLHTNSVGNIPRDIRFLLATECCDPPAYALGSVTSSIRIQSAAPRLTSMNTDVVPPLTSQALRLPLPWPSSCDRVLRSAGLRPWISDLLHTDSVCSTPHVSNEPRHQFPLHQP